jgi:hypothetical protein
MKVSIIYEASFVEDIIAIYRLHPGNISLIQKDLAFLEAIEIVSRYLPNKYAKKGLNYWSSLFILSTISRKRVNKKAILFYLKYGSIGQVIKLFIRYYE